MSSKLCLLLKEDVNSAIAFYKSVNDKSSLIKMEIDNDLWGPLHWAAHHGSTELCGLLLGDGADINAQTVQGFTALYIAARQGKLDTVILLLERGASPNLQDGHHQTALHRACENSLEEIAVTLVTLGLKNGIDLNIQDLMGRTALHWAAAKDLSHVATLLVENGAKVLKTKGGEDAIHWASRSGSENVITALLKSFSDSDPINIFSKNEREESAVDLAATESIRDLLLAHAASLGYKDDGKVKIHNVSQATTVKRLDHPNKPVGGATASGSTSSSKQQPKKLTVKLKPKQ